MTQKAVVLEKVKFALASEVSGDTLESLNIQTVEDWAADRITVAVRGHVWGSEVKRSVEESLEIPTTWWQHFKQAVFPSWLLSRYPARMKRIDVVVRHYHNCPHLPSVSYGTHLQFISLDDETLREMRDGKIDARNAK